MKRVKRYGLLVGVVAAAGIPLIWMLLSAENGHATVPDSQTLRANGLVRAEYEVLGEDRAKAYENYVLESAAGVARIVQIRQEGGRDVAVIQAGVVPGVAKLVVSGPAGKRVVGEVEVLPDWRDGNRNGFPDSLELSDPADARAFLDWFRFLAEEQYYRGDALDPEVNDCAALLRYAYREALRRHDGEWAVRLGLKAVKPIPDILRYHYPFTPLRADLFRLKAGEFEVDDLSSGVFGQFADAETLLLYNATAIGKDIGQARPGDLLFYKQEGQQMPFHAMLFLGPSTMEPVSEERSKPVDYVLYHTGPDGSWRGEMRRPSLAELFHHPEPRWHPSAANPTFLGVYRWKILGQPVMN